MICNSPHYFEQIKIHLISPITQFLDDYRQQTSIFSELYTKKHSIGDVCFDKICMQK